MHCSYLNTLLVTWLLTYLLTCY